ncbi:MAG: hypothetical protein LAO20_02850 [Acidobacteriia bacterium]|nr:hypothetical protein [Terriglobia bacterium]
MYTWRSQVARGSNPHRVPTINGRVLVCKTFRHGIRRSAGKPARQIKELPAARPDNFNPALCQLEKSEIQGEELQAQHAPPVRWAMLPPPEMPDCTAGCKAGLIASWNLLLKQRPAVSRLVFLWLKPKRKTSPLITLMTLIERNGKHHGVKQAS